MSHFACVASSIISWIGKAILVFMVMTVMPYCVVAQDAGDKDDLSGFNDYVFYNRHNAVCSPHDAYWYRGTPDKDGAMFPFVGYYLSGHQYVYGFYSSLDSGGIKNGYFLFFDTLGGVIREGAYEHNLRMGEWRYYKRGSPNVWYSEKYDVGKLTEFSNFYPDGKLRREEVYRQLTLRSKEIVSANCFDSLGNKRECNLIPGKDELPGVTEDTSRISDDQNSDKLSKKHDANVAARVWVRFRVALDGYVDQITIVRSTNPKFNIQAAKTVETMPRWKVGTAKQDAIFVLPLVFKKE